jgi:hypothetical protein
MTLTTPKSFARAELVLQWPNAANLCGIVTRMPSTLEVTAKSAMTAARPPAGTCMGMQTPS